MKERGLRKESRPRSCRALDLVVKGIVTDERKKHHVDAHSHPKEFSSEFRG
jgi:hypothetical protein